jgi:26S proteasome regulatory subunit N7
MVPYYESLIATLNFPKDAALLDTFKTANDAELKRIDAILVDAQENLGETEVTDALLAKANHFARIGDVTNGIPAYNLAIEKTGPLGRRIDLNFSLIRMGFFSNDVDLISSTIDKVKMYCRLISV